MLTFHIITPTLYQRYLRAEVESCTVPRTKALTFYLPRSEEIQVASTHRIVLDRGSQSLFPLLGARSFNTVSVLSC